MKLERRQFDSLADSLMGVFQLNIRNTVLAGLSSFWIPMFFDTNGENWN
jgi:hypothetical protein